VLGDAGLVEERLRDGLDGAANKILKERHLPVPDQNARQGPLAWTVRDAAACQLEPWSVVDDPAQRSLIVTFSGESANRAWVWPWSLCGDVVRLSVGWLGRTPPGDALVARLLGR
jgi:hypothetical protein